MSFRAATLFCLGWAVGMFAGAGHAAGSYSADEVKAAFLFRFAGYIDWPATALNDRDFTIAVMGADNVAAKLQLLLPKYTVKDRPALLRRIKDVQELGDAQVLYIGPRYKGDLRNLIAAVAKRPVLVVTDDARGLDAGSTVNFLLVDRRVRFEVSLAAAERSGLKISSELLSVAARVHGGKLRSEVPCIRTSPSGETDNPCAVSLAKAGTRREMRRR